MYKGFKEIRLRKLVEATPTYKIRSAAVGLGEIYGSVVPKQTELFESPFTKKKCVYLKYTIEEFRRQGKSSRWVTIAKIEKTQKFYLQDETGKMLVDSKGCDLRLEKDYESTTLTPEVKAVLDEHKISHTGWFGFNKTMRFREYVIEPSDNLYILGTIGDNPEVEEGSAERGHEDLMMQLGKTEKTYVISDKSEKEFMRNLGIGWFMVIGGGGLIIAGVAMILMELGLFKL